MPEKKKNLLKEPNNWDLWYFKNYLFIYFNIFFYEELLFSNYSLKPKSITLFDMVSLYQLKKNNCEDQPQYK